MQCNINTRPLQSPAELEVYDHWVEDALLGNCRIIREGAVGICMMQGQIEVSQLKALVVFSAAIQTFTFTPNFLLASVAVISRTFGRMSRLIIAKRVERRFETSASTVHLTRDSTHRYAEEGRERTTSCNQLGNVRTTRHESPKQHNVNA